MQVQQDGFLNTRELNKNDVCDRCAAEAFIVATKGLLELLFCGHHGKLHRPELMKTGWRIQDDTYKLNASSNVDISV